ncbi:putative nuclease HARBI1 [Tenebrio molitor]|uniref:putative nuclease HARBI1 n=1 Tax=Tenebrio molitor TaxID=7067 RepID=UPI003624800F
MDNDEDIFEDDLEILDIIDFGFPRQIYNSANHFVNLDELSFFRRFRLTKNTTLALLVLIEEELEFPSDINQSVSPITQWLTCLRYYATDGHLMAIADFIGMHTSTVSRIILRISRAIASLGQRFIKMPEQLQQTAQDFFVTARFPRATKK